MHVPGTPHPRRWWILAALCLSLLVLVIDNTILNLAIPSLMTELGADTADIQWIVSGYTLAYAGLLLTAGGLSDRFGRRRMLVIGLTVFGLASLLATFATTPEQLIAGRAAMGVGGSLVMPSTMAILITVFDETQRRKAIAAWSAVSITGVLIGPSLGGLLLDHFWWGSVFLINVPVAALAIAAAVLLMPESKGPKARPDILGALLCTLGMVGLVWAIIAAPDSGWNSLASGGVIAVAIALLIGFVIWQLRCKHPMIPLRVLGDRRFSGGTVSVMLLAFAAGGMMLALVQYVQLVLDYDVFETGMALLPFAASAAVCNAVGAAVAKRISDRTLVTTGLLVTAVGFTIMITLEPAGGYSRLVTALVIMGLGAGLAAPAAVSALMGAIPTAHAGAGSAMNTTFSQAGNAIGVAVLGSILATGYTSRLGADSPAAGKSLAEAVSLDPETATAARAAFTTALAHTMLAAAILATIAAAVSFVMLRKSTATPTPADTQADRDLVDA